MSGRIRVMQVVNSLAPAGAERMTVDLARSLPAHEFDVRVMVVRDGPLRAILEDAGVTVEVVGGDFDWRWPTVVSRMRKRIRDFGPHVVHTHLTGSDIVGGLAAHFEHVPVLLKTQHDTYRRAPVFGLFRRRTAAWLDAVVAVSPQMVAFCTRDLHVEPERVRVIENGVDVDRFAAGISARHDPLTFGAIGSLIPVKGHAVALEAFALARERLPRARLLIAGRGPESDPLVRRAEALGIAPALELVGQVAVVPAFLARVDIALHPSHQEGAPLALLEAMAARKPIIASDLPAIRNVLDDGNAGELVPPGDPVALADAMVRLATDGALADSLAAAGYERANAHYALDHLARTYAALYRELLAGKVTPA